jgi:hypothetical protein
VQEAHLPDPGTIADDHAVAMITFEDCVVSDVHMVADLNIFRVDYHDAWLKHDSLTEPGKVLSFELA